MAVRFDFVQEVGNSDAAAAAAGCACVMAMTANAAISAVTMVTVIELTTWSVSARIITAPEGMEASPQAAGSDPTLDSDINADGVTDVILLTSDAPTTADVDAGFVTLAGPEAQDDSSTGNTIGDTVTVPVLDNDEGDLDPSTVRIIDPGSGLPVDRLTVDGEGTWSVDPETGDITFTPEDGFEGNPTPIQYAVTDMNGNTVTATVTITYRAVTPTPKPDNPGDTKPDSPSGTLPQTGVNAAVPYALGAGGLLLFLGGGLWLAARLRRLRD